MGYKKSFNLVTLQLIIPLSTMTKAEYKNAYGIDLDDIDIERVTLLHEDGNKNKYFVDEIKTTEDGVDIYAGGNILSIGESSVSVNKNAYSVDNAKPIYCHPIEIAANNSDSSIILKLAFLIFNNSETPFTFSSFISYIKGLYDLVGETVNIVCTGASLRPSGDGLSLGKLTIVDKIYCPNSNIVQVGGLDLDGKSSGLYSLEATWNACETQIFSDGVNKIN